MTSLTFRIVASAFLVAHLSLLISAGLSSDAWVWTSGIGKFEKMTSMRWLNDQIFENPTSESERCYPFRMWLQGSCQSVSDNGAQLRAATCVFAAEGHHKDRSSFIIAPQHPSADLVSNKEMANNSMTLIADLLSRLPINESRVRRTYSPMGEFGTSYLVANYPRVFAATVPVFGGGRPKSAEAPTTILFWIFRGEKENMASGGYSRVICETTREAGGQWVTHTELGDERHRITGPVYANSELYIRMFEHRRKVSATTQLPA